MVFEFIKCGTFVNKGGMNILSDLGQFQYIDEYLEALVAQYEGRKDSLSFLPLTCAVVVGEEKPEMRYIVKDGELCDDADKHIIWLKKLSIQMRQILGDHTHIIGTMGVDGALFFDWM